MSTLRLRVTWRHRRSAGDSRLRFLVLQLAAGAAVAAVLVTFGRLLPRAVALADEIAAAAYHPAGKHIAAVGVGRDGLGPGLFVATNRGGNPQRFGLPRPPASSFVVPPVRM